MRLVLFLLFSLYLGLAQAQNGVAISVTGPTSVCPTSGYTYLLQVTGTNVCYIEVSSTGGHRYVCGTAHNFADTSPTSDFGSFMTPNYPAPFTQGTQKSICIHWVSSGSKSLCFTAYDCSGAVLSTFCLTITNNSPSFYVQGNTYVCNGQWAYFTVPCGLTNYAWTVVADNFETYSPNNAVCVVNIGNLTSNSWHLVSAQARDCWGTTLYASKSFWTTACLQKPGAEDRDFAEPVDETDGSEIRVYPNPVDPNQPVSLEWLDAPLEIISFQLYSMDGKLLKSGNTPQPAGSFELVMPETPGVYFLVLTNSNQQQSRHKLVVTQ